MVVCERMISEWRYAYPWSLEEGRISHCNNNVTFLDMLYHRHQVALKLTLQSLKGLVLFTIEIWVTLAVMSIRCE